jgi:hypothetical protein
MWVGLYIDKVLQLIFTFIFNKQNIVWAYLFCFPLHAACFVLFFHHEFIVLIIKGD